MSNLPTPNGLPEIIAAFGDLTTYIQDDATLSTKWETDEMSRTLLPFPIPLGGDHSRSVTRIECHQKLIPIFLQVFQAIADRGFKDLVTSYDGCYSPRRKRVNGDWSTHAWGIAVDINSETNQQGTKGNMDPRLIAIFQEFGFKWGGEFSGRAIDPMHFQYATGY